MPTIQDHRTTGTPSVISIVVFHAAAGAAGGASIWVATGETFDGRHLVGLLLGILATTVLLGQAGGRLGARVTGRAKTTGTWRHPERGVVQFSFWDWPDHERLTQVLTEMEDQGYVPADDADTREIRARLMLRAFRLTPYSHGC